MKSFGGDGACAWRCRGRAAGWSANHPLRLRERSVRRLLGEVEASEDDGAFVPISTYGASKLAGEALIGAYCFMFGLVSHAFHFGNVVGYRQSHRVGFDFVRRLAVIHSAAGSWGTDGRASRTLTWDDVVEAVLTALRRESAPFQFTTSLPEIM